MVWSPLHSAISKPHRKPNCTMNSVLPSYFASAMMMMNRLIFICFCSLYLQISMSLALTSPQDIAALKAFKAAIKPTSIPSWSCVASWDFASDPCALPRRSHFTCAVTCSADSTRVIRLSLDSVGYSGRLTPLVSQLSQLTVLDLSDNNFYGSIPPSISSLSALQYLELRSNSFSGSLPDSISSLKSLLTLDLSRNSLSGPFPKSMNALSNLNRLDLSYNRITGPLPKLPVNLVELASKNNSLSGYISKSSFDGMSRLEVVELSENSFTGTLRSWFFLLPAIQQVDLAKNSLTSVEIPKPPTGGSDLVAVDLGFNKVQGNVPVNLAYYPLLTSLSLRYNRFRGTIPPEYSEKKSLRRLFLDGNFLDGKPPAGFFSGEVAGSLGDNCLQTCPGSSKLCTPSQKPYAVCKQAYGGKPES